ncbi:MAG: alpha/beta hydrolase-fold protein [Acidobacteriota bacterium]
MTASKITYRGTVRIVYPPTEGRIVVRAEPDWSDDLPTVIDDDGGHCITLEAARPHRAFKPCLIEPDGTFRWAIGDNKLAILGVDDVQAIYPHFLPARASEITDILPLISSHLGRIVRLRVYLPSGYFENWRKRYPVLYMHDGANLFFPDEAFAGNDWRIDETLRELDRMNLIDRTIVVGVYAEDREAEYTRPGYETYGRALVEEIKPHIDRRFRTLPGRAHTGVMGSSLGGVVSFYMAWERPDVFGLAACLSSTFGYRDDLLQRVHDDDPASRQHLRIYLDSGWPRDNYETTLAMANGLLDAGFQYGTQLAHFAFPGARHSEVAWAARVHLPLQLFTGKLARRARLADRARADAG